MASTKWTRNPRDRSIFSGIPEMALSAPLPLEIPHTFRKLREIPKIYFLFFSVLFRFGHLVLTICCPLKPALRLQSAQRPPGVEAPERVADKGKCSAREGLFHEGRQAVATGGDAVQGRPLIDFRQDDAELARKCAVQRISDVAHFRARTSEAMLQHDEVGGRHAMDLKEHVGMWLERDNTLEHVGIRLIRA